jgi:DNA-binding CsgD family transcriptional regulator
MAHVNHGIRARALDRVAQLDGARLDLPALIAESSALLARALPREAACWHTMDPATLVETSFRIEDIPPGDHGAAQLAYLPTDYNAFPALARAGRHSGVLSEATGGDMRRSVRYREMLAPHGIRGELRTSLVADGAGWGCFAFFRHGKDFTSDERDFAHDVGTILAKVFRSAGVRARGASAGLWPGVIVIGEDRRVESVTTPARRWLDELGTPFPGEHTSLPFVVHAIAARVGSTGEPANARALGTSGEWIEVLGSPAEGPDRRVVIVLQAATAPSLIPLICAAHGLTPRERELADLVYQGLATKDITARLFISPHTVQQHLKSIFAKTGVRSRRELVARVLSAPASA